MDRALLDLMKRRRSIRSWTSQPVEEYKLQKILEAAVWAPSGSNTQTLRFKVIRDPEDVKTIATMKNMDVPNIVIIVLRLPASLEAEWSFLKWQDAAASIQNMLLMAEALGLAACWASWAFPHGKRGFERFLGCGSKVEVCGSMFLGYSDMKINLETYKHQGRLVKRKPVDHYVLG